jgi:phosphopentomutase
VARVALLILDGVGIGDAPDAYLYGDEGSNTLGNTARVVGGLHLPHLQALGLGNIAPIEGVPPTDSPRAAWGRMTERSAGKDTITGHWEMMGLVGTRPFPTYPDGFPAELIAEFERRTGRPVIGNRPASGTVIIEELFDEHLATGALIVYTSADSVFQVAAHEDVVPVEELYRCCRIARELLVGEHCVARVIARPFIGAPGNLRRTERRRDFALPPPEPTVLDHLAAAGVETWAVGKIEDIFSGRGIAHAAHTGSNAEGCALVLRLLRERIEGLIFANLNDFDSKFGHRNAPEAYAQALAEFDAALAELLPALGEDGLLMITADHGTDPTTVSTDHSRERAPLLVTGAGARPVALGTRDTFADVGATLCALWGAVAPRIGTSFAGELFGGGAW